MESRWKSLWDSLGPASLTGSFLVGGEGRRGKHDINIVLNFYFIKIVGVLAKCAFCMSVIECGMALGRSRHFKILYLRHFIILAQFTFGIDFAHRGWSNKHSKQGREAEPCAQGERLMSTERPLVLRPQTANSSILPRAARQGFVGL